MIKNIIFDFGDIFINLDKTGAMSAALELFNVPELTPEMLHINMRYEKGLLSTTEFIQFYTTTFPNTTKEQVVQAWNHILLDFPLHRLEFLKKVSTQYRCFLLSNTNEMHIDWIKNDWGPELYNEFKACFDTFYLSHEMHMRKPDAEIYKYVLDTHQLIPQETLFIDDTKENTDTTERLHIHSWNLTPGKEDVTELFTIKSELF
ncbi:MAG: HAD family hydrolase [Flavobacteriaceae bacterium]